MVYITAEIGINHNGDIAKAFKIIDAAKAAGADAVKFQKRNPHKCIPKERWHDKVISPVLGQMMHYINHKTILEFSKEEYDQINDYCNAIGIHWYASVWDIDSLKFMLQYRPLNIKIPSAMITNIDLLKETAEAKRHTFISTGMCEQKDIAKAVRIFKDAECPFTLMHCVSHYPAHNEELNLSLIQHYKNLFSCPVGYSGHEFGTVPSVVAVALGATAIERHITLDRTMPGTDHIASLGPVDFHRLVHAIRTAEVSIGNPIKRILPTELPAMKKLRGIQ